MAAGTDDRGSIFRGTRPHRVGRASVVSLVVLAGLVASSFFVTASAAHVGATVPVSTPSPAVTPPRPPEPPAAAASTSVAPAASGGAACAAGTPANSAADASSTPARSGAAVPAPSVLFNSAVSPYAIYTGPYGYVAGGAALRDLGYGEIDLSWPGPSTSKLVAAYLIWSILNNSTPPATAELNGHAIVGTWTAFATPSPCWSPTYIYTFVADVTSDIVNGENQVTDVPSSITNGSDPWADGARFENGLLDDGASLVAIYDSGSADLRQITVFTGAETTEGGSLEENLNFSAATSTAVNTTYIVSDGQLPGNSAYWNHTLVAANAFPGDDPKDTSTPWSEGNLSDTRSYSVSVPLGATNVTAEIASDDEGDCLTWIGQVVSVAVSATPPPYTVTFEEQGLTAGTEWTVTIGASSETGTAADSGSAVAFDLANGTYDYQITPIPGYNAQYKGSFTIAGGGLYLRVPFHIALYSVTFGETGLPTGDFWWVELVSLPSTVIGNESVAAPNPISYQVPNGSYAFFDGMYGLYLSKEPKGTQTVDGPGVYGATIAFVPPPLFPVTFREYGLAPGTTWGGYLYTNFGDFRNSTSARTFVDLLPNSTEYGVDSVEPLAVAGYDGPGDIYFEVHAAPATVDVNYSALYPVNFTESGLPSDTLWEMNLSGTPYEYYASSYTNLISYSVANGTYTFEVTHVYGYAASPISGTLTVAGENLSTKIVFSLSATFPVYYNETGLPAGTNWSVEILQPNYAYVVPWSTTRSIEVFEPNGTFDFYVDSLPGYADTPSSGSYRVAGHAYNVDIRYQRTYSVRFHERGLPSGTSWEVLFNDSYASSYTASLKVLTVNGTFPYTVYPPDAFTATPASGSVTVDGANVTVSIVFSSAEYPTYPVTITESGLPAGSNWTFELDYSYNTSTGTSMNYTEENGSFPFYAFDVGEYVPTTEYGTITVSGAPASYEVVYTIPGYSVTFFETGLPGGATWAVTLDDVQEFSTNGTILFTEYSGSYTYVAQSAGYVAAPTRGPVDVVDESVRVDIAFSLAAYSVEFTETGLADGTAWWVNITEGPSIALSSTSGAYSLTNGTYTYTVGTTEKTEAAGGGEFTVDADEPTVTVVFSPVLFAVTVTESGLPVGSTWWVNVTGQAAQKVVDATSTVLELINGSYSYTASTAVHGYGAPGGSFVVHGTPTPVAVTFRNVPVSSSPNFLGLPGDEGYYVLGGIVLLGALFAIFLVAARRRRKSTPVPPPPPIGGGGPGGPSS